jgi:hypothetical protein
MRWSRWWPAAGYVLATVLVQCVHEHHGAVEAARCDVTCADDRTHLSGHTAPDSSHAPSDCLACQFRGEPHLWLQIQPPVYLRPSVTVAATESPSRAPSRPGRSISCRAPPRV